MTSNDHRPGWVLTASLHHLALGSENPEALARFYGRALGMHIKAAGTSWVAQARERLLVFVPGAAQSLAYAAFAVPDAAMLDGLKASLDAQGWPYTQTEAHGLAGNAIGLRDPDGNLFIFGLTIEEPAQFEAAANRPARLQHVVMASRQAQNLAGFFQTHLGFVLSDNVVDDAGAIRTSFLRCGHEHHNFAVFQAGESRLDHHCYEAGEWGLIRDWADHMAAQRIPLKWGPGRHGPGNNLFMFIHDSDGNWVEISAEIEQVTPDRPAGIWPHEEFTLNSWGQGFLRS